MTARLKPCSCPKCGVSLDAATDASGGDAEPRPGDVTICFYCQSVLEFTEEMEFEKINIKDLQPEVQDVIVMMLAQLQEAQDNRTLH